MAITLQMDVIAWEIWIKQLGRNVLSGTDWYSGPFHILTLSVKGSNGFDGIGILYGSYMYLAM